MEENKDKPVISISQMAEELHTQYRYYFRLILNVIHTIFVIILQKNAKVLIDSRLTICAGNYDFLTRKYLFVVFKYSVTAFGNAVISDVNCNVKCKTIVHFMLLL